MNLRTFRNIIFDCRSAPWLGLLWLPAGTMLLFTLTLFAIHSITAISSPFTFSIAPTSTLITVRETCITWLIASQMGVGILLALICVCAGLWGTPRCRAHCALASGLYLLPVGLHFARLFMISLSDVLRTQYDVQPNYAPLSMLATVFTLYVVFAIVLFTSWPLARRVVIPWAIACAICTGDTFLTNNRIHYPTEPLLYVNWGLLPIAITYLVNAMPPNALLLLTAPPIPSPDAAP